MRLDRATNLRSAVSILVAQSDHRTLEENVCPQILWI